MAATTAATTPRTAKTQHPTSNTPTATLARLIWRGCLSFQGWPLEGFCFTTNTYPLPSPNIHSSIDDLTLALEMTRHRPLRVCDRLNLNLDKWIIENTYITVWVDPRAIPSKRWLERVFGASSSTHLHAVIVSLDDVADEPDPSNEFIIFRDNATQSLNLGRRKKKVRESANVARPDDPLPRTNVPAQPKLAPLDRLNMRKSSSELSRLFPSRPSSESSRRSSDKAMKPPESKRKRSSLIPAAVDAITDSDTDASKDSTVFGTPSNNQTQANNKSSFKNQMLATFANYNLSQSHPEFNQLWSICIKGVSFAFRHRIHTDIIDKEQIDQVVLKHLSMYLPNRPSVKVVK
ncbi:hypothetical protein E3P77_01711 [Wallemia ichthyophaga]|uniref:Sld7 C-terminal domain-containing protein n=2 Tax=Wallemia ichthyophaga TaxID=245174 RepID=A0A4T0IXM6_WALIC|nr:uncharacterized protein J056_004724 [Wallemia ichthyophaga EXF-994]TIA74846.1 hypothetical protein E3P91_00704 [Wallemia ichthyophaga]EOR00912.1 hypothetical protein J056_004724 [Wallemia ichthyophaga EXF-994]TIB03795.1 hypothetical protein E3P95_00413 [Wallemia ichthyophaga]TIB04979.1 hypothetical protein E3P94_00413 [Wallemia ichthyophaga]TIB34127.1 hypothetical protein E3P86_02880 [Wallemia ichthyophaga]